MEEEEDQEEIQREAFSLGPDAVGTPQPVRALIQGERGYSSAVKYKITATPGYVFALTLPITQSFDGLW